MTSRRQLILTVLIVAGAVAVTLGLAGGGEPPVGGGGGHDHSSMAATEEARPVELTDEMRRRIGITYATAEEGRVERGVRAVGTVTYDERRLVSLNPKVDGWVDELYVDYTGAEVRRGEPMLRLYSPAMVAAQEELLLARRLLDRTSAAPDSRAAANGRELLEAARRRLAYWDVPEDEIRRIEETGTPRKSLLLRAPASGVVVEKHVQEGGRVMPGSPLYHIADLSTVWVEAEVFEKDLALVREGQEGTVTLEAYPGEQFTGRVSYVYPTVSVEARTARVRLELPNPEGHLKPGMYATVRLRGDGSAEAGVMIPRSAVLNTGERSVVFVRGPGERLLPREVRTGLADGARVTILEGVAAGETVVSSAAFLVDAESSLGAAMKAMETEAEPAPGAGARGEDAGSEHAGHGAG